MNPTTPLFRISNLRHAAPRLCLAATLCAAIAAAPLPGQALGILVPRDPAVSPIQLGDSDVKVDISQNIAKTRVAQEFRNPNGRQLEADFYFPVPKGADVTDFALSMDGKMVKGEVLESGKAREIYEGIVRRMKDPGLLEWADRDLFKVRVFPVPANGSQKIELEFAQPLASDQGTFRYTFPIRTPGISRAGRDRLAMIPNVNFRVVISADEPLRNIYSPSHGVDVDSSNPRKATVLLPQKSLTLDGPNDFVLYYEPSAKDVALSLLATRASDSEDGFFSLMLSPPIKGEASQVAPQDITFVIDTSGSMNEDEKIAQARRALSTCVSMLRPVDRFGMVRFSTDVDRWKQDLVSASKENVDSAKDWIKALEARGGTNISDALGEALAMGGRGKGGASDKASVETSASGSRLYTIVFITDGMPTVGETTPRKIVDRARGVAKSSGEDNGGGAGVRVFTFGVGNDVNAKLLDSLSEETRAAAEYVKPRQDMEAPLSRFFDKISRPAMTGLRLEIPGADAYDMYPKQLPDLFFGTQLTVFGRYRKAGPTAIKLTGSVAGKPAEFTYEKTLPARQPENRSVETLWGTRKIAYLLAAIRASGESAETRDEVIKLAKKYGVVTPYTSYLVAEDERPPVPGLAAMPVDRMARSQASAGGGRGTQARFEYRPENGTISPGDVYRTRPDRSSANSPSLPPAAYPPASAAAMPRFSGQPGTAAGGVSRRLVTGSQAPLPDVTIGDSERAVSQLKAESGAGAVDMSRRLAKMKAASGPATRDKDADSLTGGELRAASGRSFRLVNDAWIDTAINAGDSATRLKVKAMSQAFFDLLALDPSLREALALGERVTIKLASGAILEIGDGGKETLDEADKKLVARP